MHHKTLRRPLVVEGGTPAINIDLKRFKPIPEEGITRATEIMRAGTHFRYGGERPEDSEVSLLERDLAQYLGVQRVVATNSCGSSMFIALKTVGVRPGDEVLMNAFTFTAVPSAVHHAGARPLLVESGRDWTIDTEDLERKAATNCGKVLLLSYMRGHVPRMDEVLRIVREYKLVLVEDCAHAMCTTWDGQMMGRFGHIACFSTQSSKALSAGEGGFLATNDAEVAAKAILYSGSYERNWKKHFDAATQLAALDVKIPGYSLRMHEVTAAMLRPQIPRLAEIAPIHRKNHAALCTMLAASRNFEIPRRDPRVRLLGDTLQFHLVGVTKAEAESFIEVAAMEGVPMQIFGSKRNARDFRWWQYLDLHTDLPQTVDAIEFAVDLVLGAHLTERDVEAIGDALLRSMEYVLEQRAVNDSSGLAQAS